MDTQLTTIRDQQKETWNKFSSGWKKWDTFTMNFLRPMGDAIISSLDIKDDDVVLDIASGTGEPSLTIAALIKNGNVVGTDIADKMLDIARENAKKRNITNIEFTVADVTKLPFENNSFSKISCRMGFMFFPDMQTAANEMYRVCKKGGRIATSVWAGPEINPWVTIMMNVLKNHIDMPTPDPLAPGMFRCAKPGLIKGMLEKAGFKNVQEEIIKDKIPFETPEQYWINMTEIAAPVVAALSKTDAPTQAKIKTDVLETCKKLMKDNYLVIDEAATIICGQK